MKNPTRKFKTCTFILIVTIFIFVSSASAEKFAVGQVWNYRTRPNEEQSRVTILKMESSENDSTIFHISIEGVQLQNPIKKDSLVTKLPHLPVSRDTLEASVTTLHGTTDSLPDFSDGYRAWREAYDKGNAGIFSVPLSEVVDFVESTLQSPDRITSD